MRAAGAGSSRALRRADSAIFAFGSSASRTAADRAWGSLSPRHRSIASCTGRSVQRAGNDRSAFKAAARTIASVGGQPRTDFRPRDRPSGSMPATGPSRPMSASAAAWASEPGWADSSSISASVAGSRLPAADLERELFHHRGRPGANRAIGIAEPPRDGSGQLRRAVARES